MNFFKSVFSDEPESPPKPDSESTQSQTRSDPDPNSNDNDSTWSFGSLMKTLTTKSESVIEVYRRDLKEFGSGLKKEIETAHGSLETVSHKIDEIGTSVIKSTAQIISQGKDVIMQSDDHESDSSDNNVSDRSASIQNTKPYSRFDAQLRAIQGDIGTYSEEPDDLEEYRKWKLGFDLEERREEIGGLIAENGPVESLFKRLVPSSVDEESFWCRYYYKVFKLKQAEELRVSLVKRAISTEEEDLSWDVDDDDEEMESEPKKDDWSGVKNDAIVKSDEIKNIDSKEIEQVSNVKDEEVVRGGNDNVSTEKVDLENSKDKEVSVAKSDEKVGSEGKGGDNGGDSSKDSDVSVISSHPSMPEEEDLGWDEIEDLSSIEEKKVSSTSGSPTNKADLRKRLSAAEEEEDLSWDIEDDDEPVKA